MWGDRKKHEELRNNLGVQKKLLCWFGHIQRREAEKWVKRCTILDVGRKKPNR